MRQPLGASNVMRRPGLEPGPLAGGDFKSSPHSNGRNDLGHPHPADRGAERKSAEAGGWGLATNLATSLRRAEINPTALVAWVFLVLGFAVGTLNARTETRREVRQCLAAETDENVQFACPDWLRRLL